MTPRVLDGRYQIDARLGSGGQGHVFRGRDLVTQRSVALKLMDQGKKNDPELVARFVQEGRLAARIRDPHLVAAHHFGVSDGQRYIVYDYIPGVVPLTTLLDEGRMEPARVCDIALQLLDTLHTLHAAGVVHQDVSPANCLWCLRPSGRIEVFLIDLGSASSPITGGLRAAREPVGASDFMAPEMVRDGGVCDHRVDLWSVGAIMFTLLTGCFVDLGTEDEPLEPPPPTIIIPKIPQAVSDVVMGALTSVDRRYPSAAAMTEAILGLNLFANAGTDRHSPVLHNVASSDDPGPKTPAARTPTAAEPTPPASTPATPAWVRLGGLAAFATVVVLGTLIIERNLAPSRSTETVALTPPTPADANHPSAHAAPPDLPDANLEPVSATQPTAPNFDLPDENSESPPTQPTEPSPAAKSATTPSPGKKAQRVPGNEVELAIKHEADERVRWHEVESAIKQKANELDPCISDVYVSIGVSVAQGHVTLTSVNGKPASLKLPHHQCVHDVVAPLQFANSAAIDGVVGVPLGSGTRNG